MHFFFCCAQGTSSPVLKVSNMVVGDYAFVLKVTDTGGQTDSSTVTVVVQPEKNAPPVAVAGSDKVSLGFNCLNLNFVFRFKLINQFFAFFVRTSFIPTTLRFLMPLRATMIKRLSNITGNSLGGVISNQITDSNACSDWLKNDAQSGFLK